MLNAREDYRGRRRFQFSTRLLFVLTAIVATLVAVSISVYRERVASRRPMLFIQAVQKGDLAEVDRLLKIDPKLAHGLSHGGTSTSYTPLQMALGKPQIFSRILKERPDPDERSSNGQTALHLAVTANMVPVVQRLLRLGADANAVDDDGRTCLHAAVEYNRPAEITKLLLEAGADPNKVSSANPKNPWLDGKSPLHRAAERRNDVAVAQMLDAGAQVNCRDIKGRTALHFATSGDQSKVARLLVKHGADLTAKDNDALIPGEHADGTNSETAAAIWWEKIEQLVSKQQTKKLDQLLDAAPQALAFRTDNSQTMLGRALYDRRLDVLDYLLDRHADLETRRMHANDYLHWACNYSSADFVKRLFDAGADLAAKSHVGQTPLHAAARGHNHEVIRLLLAKGADITALDNADATPIDASFESGFDQQTFAILRQAGHPPTVLYAAATGDLDLLNKLTGGEVELLDREYTHGGVRPLHAAVMGRQPSTVKWLLARGVEPAPPSPKDRMYASQLTPLFAAINNNDAVIARFLIEAGADVNRKKLSGYYPAHAVIGWDRDPRILEALLAHGADPMLKYRGETAVDLAQKSKSEHRKRYLEVLNATTSTAATGR